MFVQSKAKIMTTFYRYNVRITSLQTLMQILLRYVLGNIYTILGNSCFVKTVLLNSGIALAITASFLTV